MKALLFIISLAISQFSLAEVNNISGNINFSSNYMYRGINRYSSSKALFSNLDYTHENCLYGGIWMRKGF